MTNIRQIRITSADINGVVSTENDCVLSPDDPVHAMIGTSMVGGLGSSTILAGYNRNQIVMDNRGNENAAIMREKGIKAGDPEWFDLWFGGKK